MWIAFTYIVLENLLRGGATAAAVAEKVSPAFCMLRSIVAAVVYAITILIGKENGAIRFRFAIKQAYLNRIDSVSILT